MSEAAANTSSGSKKPVCSWPFNQGGNSPVAPIWTKLWNGAKFAVILTIVFGGLTVAVVWLVYKSFHLSERSFYQELCVASAAALPTFLGTPIVIKLSAKRRGIVVPLMLVLGGACIVNAFFREGVLRNLLIEATVAILLIIGLEMMFHQFIHILHDRYQKAQKDLDEEAEWNQDFPFGPPRKSS